MFYKPFHYEVPQANAGDVLDSKSLRVCSVMTDEDELSTDDHLRLALILDALNQVNSSLAE